MTGARPEWVDVCWVSVKCAALWKERRLSFDVGVVAHLTAYVISSTENVLRQCDDTTCRSRMGCAFERNSCSGYWLSAIRVAYPKRRLVSVQIPRKFSTVAQGQRRSVARPIAPSRWCLCFRVAAIPAALLSGKRGNGHFEPFW